jgi:hypothetical protein
MRVSPALFVLLAALPYTAVQAGGACKPARYTVMGQVTDSSGRPLVDARVRLLLDRVSEEETADHGVRALSTRTNAAGSFVQYIDCDEMAVRGDRPSPCARNPKHVTVSATAPGLRTRLQVFKFKALEIRRDAGGCVLILPDLRLSPAY